MFVGSSVGAINAAGLGAFWHLGPEQAVDKGLEIWRQVDKDSVIRPILAWQVPITALRYAGGVLSLPKVRVPSLLDPEPLRENLSTGSSGGGSTATCARAVVDAVAVVATAARSGRTVAFTEGDMETAARRPSGARTSSPTSPRARSRARSRLRGDPDLLSLRVGAYTPKAAGWYIDGGTRLNTPLKPALDLGADRIVVVGMDAVTEPEPRHPAQGGGAARLRRRRAARPAGAARRPDDRGRADARKHERLLRQRQPRRERVSRRAREAPLPRRPVHLHRARAPWRDRRARTRKSSRHATAASRACAGCVGWRRCAEPTSACSTGLLGDDSPTHGELLSYLFFDRDFIDELIKMGQNDARRWLEAPPGPTDPWQVEPLERFVDTRGLACADLGLDGRSSRSSPLARRLVALRLVEHGLAQPHALRRDLDALVVAR